MSNEKKGITVKIDADLHAEIRQYVESKGITMAQFIELAVDNELHPKFNNNMEENNMGKMRTLAFQVDEELFQKVKKTARITERCSTPYQVKRERNSTRKSSQLTNRS
ncbi:MAG: hypothetical protein J6A90_01245 [Clostridia bacterium]|nr:hypothetical protein [Clostridia bacterium]